MTFESQLAIVPVTLAFYGFRLPDGTPMATELARPQAMFAVMIKPKDGQPQLHSVHDTEDQAEQKAAEVLSLWDGGWAEAPAGGTVQ